jgi:hypothetical protein
MNPVFLILIIKYCLIIANMKPNQIDIELLKSEINKIKNSEDLNTS